MKKMLILLLALCLLAPSALAQEQRLDAAALEARMHANPYLNLFDLRAEADFDQGHLPGAVSFPLPALRQELQQILDKGFSYMDAVLDPWCACGTTLVAAEQNGRIGYAVCPEARAEAILARFVRLTRDASLVRCAE